jgi:hypothetical protein
MNNPPTRRSTEVRGVRARGNNSRAAGRDNIEVNRDYIGRDYIRVSTGDQIPRSGLARALAFVGMMIAFAGFISFMYVVLSGIIQIWGLMGSHSTSLPNIPTLPWLPLGFGLMILGIIIVNVAKFLDRD